MKSSPPTRLISLLGTTALLMVLGACASSSGPAPVIVRSTPAPIYDSGRLTTPAAESQTPAAALPPAVAAVGSAPPVAAAGSAPPVAAAGSAPPPSTAVASTPIRTGRLESRPLPEAAGSQAPVAAAPAMPAGSAANPVEITPPAHTPAPAAPPVTVARAPASSETDPRPAVTPAPAPAAAAPAANEFSWPAKGSVMQTFSDPKSMGIAIAGKVGDPVSAAADGKVIFSGLGPRGYGKLLIVKHQNDLLSVYANNDSLLVREGQAVKQGQKIAELGSSGTDAPKLHFEIRRQGKPVDPIGLLPRR
ncbi:MAG: peptidoglycan DD-metalloendopeptidase family protein [Burkholderiaceae bacterium]